jgi:putative ABC transport system ATP-binding protein
VTAETLAARDVTVVRGGRTILDGVTLTAEPGERVAIVGPSGAGKSTLLAALAGLERPDSGTLHLGQSPLRGTEALRRFGIVLQGYGLLSLLTAAENVELALQARRVPPPDVKAAAARLLAAVGLAGRAGHLVEELSGGEQQRVAVARALVTGPDIVLADEPTAELDAAARGLVLDLLLDRSPAAGRTLLIATHDPEVAARCDRTVHISAGRVVP